MTKLLSAILFLGCLALCRQAVASEYDVATFYKGVTPADGSKSLSSFDELQDVKLILIPITIDAGKYVFKVTRKGPNLYQIDGKNIYIETKYCYEYPFGKEVVLNVDSRNGYTKGKLIF